MWPGQLFVLPEDGKGVDEEDQRPPGHLVNDIDTVSLSLVDEEPEVKCPYVVAHKHNGLALDPLGFVIHPVQPHLHCVRELWSRLQRRVLRTEWLDSSDSLGLGADFSLSFT